MEIFPVYENFNLNSDSTIFIAFFNISQLYESTLKITFKTQQYLLEKWFICYTCLKDNLAVNYYKLFTWEYFREKVSYLLITIFRH